MAVIKAQGISTDGKTQVKIVGRKTTQVKKVIVGTPIRRVNVNDDINSRIPVDFIVNVTAGSGKAEGALLTFNEGTGEFQPLLRLGDNVVSDGGGF